MRMQQKDIPQVAQLWYAGKQQTCFGGLRIEWNYAMLATHLLLVSEKPGCYIAVKHAQDGQIVHSFCAVSLVKPLTPPHPLVVTEWAWFARENCPKRDIAQVWQECEQWGKDHGAVLSHRAKVIPSMKSTRWTEISQWRAL
jgi:hypothetical protein